MLWNNINRSLLTEFCINKETFWLLVSEAAKFSQPPCLAHLPGLLLSSQNLSTVGAGPQQFNGEGIWQSTQPISLLRGEKINIANASALRQGTLDLWAPSVDCKASQGWVCVLITLC